MRKLPFFLSLLLLAAFPAQAAVTVLGSGESGRRCWLAAERPYSRDGLKDCNFAIENERLNRRDLAATYTNRAIILTGIRSYRAANADIAKALEIAPDMPEIYLNRGNLRYMQRQFTEALADYDRSLAMGLVEVHAGEYNRGLVLELLGRRSEAEAAFRRSVESAPGFTLALEKVAEYDELRAKRSRQRSLAH